MGFSQKPASTKLEVGFLSGILKVGFVEKYGLSQILRTTYFQLNLKALRRISTLDSVSRVESHYSWWETDEKAKFQNK